MASPHTQHSCRGALATAQSGHRWKGRLLSSCLSDQLAAAILRSRWSVAGRPKAAGVILSIGERHADGHD